MSTRYLINGEAGGLDPGDRGVAYGDGLFETMAAADGAIPHFALHLDRLTAGCERLGIPCPSRADIEGDIARVVPNDGPAVVKLIVTRGAGARGYAPPAHSQPTRIVSVSPWPDYPERLYRDGIRVHVCNLRLGTNPALAGLKHLSRLEYVLANGELAGVDAHQGLLLDSRQLVVGGTSSNVFIVRRRALATPLVTHCGVAGVKRRVVIEAARELGLHVHECELTLPETLAADEIFMTNAVFGIWPVTTLDSRRFDLGPITERLLARLGYSRGG